MQKIGPRPTSPEVRLADGTKAFSSDGVHPIVLRGTLGYFKEQ